MKGLLDGPRTIVADLVRKRLWPIAVLLLVALVAIPLLIGSSSSAPVPPPADGVVAAAPPPAAQEAAPTTPRERAARVRDPFFDPPAGPSDDEGAAKQSDGPSDAASPQTAAEPPAAKPSAATPSAAAGAKPSSPAAKNPAAAAPAPADRPSASTGTYHRTAARLAAGATSRPLARLTPIGKPAKPAAVYLGVMKVGQPYAVFVLGRRSTSRGEATCAAETDCRIIGLRPGDTQRITVYTADGHVSHRYVLRVTSVKPVTTSAAKARARRAEVHRDGRDAARAMSRDAAVAAALRRVGYRRTTGLLFSEAPDVLEQATR